MNFIKGVFSDNGSPSASRVLTAISTIACLVYVGYVVFHTHKLPDGGSLTGMAGFAAAPYACNTAGKIAGR